MLLNALIKKGTLLNKSIQKHSEAFRSIQHFDIFLMWGPVVISFATSQGQASPITVLGLVLSRSSSNKVLYMKY
jgi:hypothetical protein